MPNTRADFGELADRLPEALLLVDTDATVQAANPAAAGLLGKADGGPVGRPLMAFVRDDEAAIAALIRAASRSREFLPGGLTVVRPDGSAVACRCESSLYRPRSADNSALVLLRLSGREAASNRFILLNDRIEELSREITRRRVAEEALRSATEYFRVTLASIGDAVIATDTAGCVTFMNPVAERLTGWSLARATGKHLDEVFVIVNETTRQTVESPVAKVIREGGIVGLANHTVLIRADGSEVPIDDSGAPILDGSGAMVGVVLVFHDISERHALEKEVERKTQRLEEADRRKDEFLSMLAHELRNPLAPLKTGVHLLEHKQPAMAEVSRLCRMMDRQIGHMVRLVDDLLDVSRLTRGKIELRTEPVRIAEAIEQAVEMVRSAAQTAGLTLEVPAIAPDLVVDGDLTRLVQVFANLLTNATKFTARGGTITIVAGRAEASIEVRVTDTGVGIAPELLSSIFDLFVQGENSLDRSEGGLGIGLTVVRSIVELHGGSVSAFSEGPGHGSSFVVCLPLTDPRCSASDRGVHAKAPVSATPELRVLVVDDNIDAAETLSSILEMWGHEPTVARSAMEALDQLTSVRPQAALLDIGLPGMNGYELARAIRKMPQIESIFLVAVTGYGDASARAESMEAGFDQHMTKPVDIGELQSLLAALSR
ncbi:hypothetical protein BZM26_37560 [Paraburkholderia strydomiana]|nr:hypothetical protein BZM26_37560 [Paraburkholderia strydomiana]